MLQMSMAVLPAKKKLKKGSEWPRFSTTAPLRNMEKDAATKSGSESCFAFETESESIGFGEITPDVGPGLAKTAVLFGLLLQCLQMFGFQAKQNMRKSDYVPKRSKSDCVPQILTWSKIDFTSNCNPGFGTPPLGVPHLSRACRVGASRAAWWQPTASPGSCRPWRAKGSRRSRSGRLARNAGST